MAQQFGIGKFVLGQGSAGAIFPFSSTCSFFFYLNFRDPRERQKQAEATEVEKRERERERERARERGACKQRET